jgi:hypothetical protein
MGSATSVTVRPAVGRAPSPVVDDDRSPEELATIAAEKKELQRLKAAQAAKQYDAAIRLDPVRG